MDDKVKELEGQVEKMAAKQGDDEVRINELETKMTDVTKENEELKRKLEMITKLQESNHLRPQVSPLKSQESDSRSDKVDSAWSNA